MVTTSTRILLTITMIPLLSTLAHAQGPLRRYDDLTFTALTAARDLRWEIHDEFERSRDQKHLLQDVENLISDLHLIQKMIYQRRSARELDKELDHALEHVAELKTHLLGCDFAKQHAVSFQLNAKGYVFHPETRHGGRVHVDHALTMLAGIEGNLKQLHRELAGAPVPHTRPHVVAPVKPSNLKVTPPGRNHSIRIPF